MLIGLVLLLQTFTLTPMSGIIRADVANDCGVEWIRWQLDDAVMLPLVPIGAPSGSIAFDTQSLADGYHFLQVFAKPQCSEEIETSNRVGFNVKNDHSGPGVAP